MTALGDRCIIQYMAYPKKEERNKDLVKKRKQGWSYRKLAIHFNLDVKTIYEILQRELLGDKNKQP